MVQFHLTVELPFPDIQDFFRLDVSSPQFVRLFTAGSFMFFPPELVELFGDWWFRLGFIRLLLFFFITRYVPVPQLSPPVYHAVPVPVPMKSPGKVVKVPVPLPAKTLVKHKVFWAEVGEVGWGWWLGRRFWVDKKSGGQGVTFFEGLEKMWVKPLFSQFVSGNESSGV